jgi:hypothetical protein
VFVVFVETDFEEVLEFDHEDGSLQGVEREVAADPGGHRDVVADVEVAGQHLADSVEQGFLHQGASVAGRRGRQRARPANRVW